MERRRRRRRSCCWFGRSSGGSNSCNWCLSGSFLSNYLVSNLQTARTQRKVDGLTACVGGGAAVVAGGFDTAGAAVVVAGGCSVVVVVVDLFFPSRFPSREFPPFKSPPNKLPCLFRRSPLLCNLGFDSIPSTHCPIMSLSSRGNLILITQLTTATKNEEVEN